MSNATNRAGKMITKLILIWVCLLALETIRFKQKVNGFIDSQKQENRKEQ